jgi:hypothetical protein
VGAIGGADLKSLIILSLLSPGLEFAVQSEILLKVFLGDCLRILLMLVFGLLYGRLTRPVLGSHSDERSTPLIPLLLLAYLFSQPFALV